MKHLLTFLTIFLTLNISIAQSWKWLLTSEGLEGGTIDFVDNLNGFKAQHFDYLSVTIDGGYSWNLHHYPFTNQIWDLSFVNKQIGWVCGSDGLIAKTADGGKSWTIQNIITDTLLQSIVFVDSLVGWAGGHYGVLLKTNNGGNTWSHVTGINTTIRDLDFINSQEGCIVGTDMVMKTTDGGQTWTDITPYTPLYDVHRTVEVLDNQNIWVAGNVGRLYKTTDGGSTWTNYNNLMNDDYLDISFTNPQTGFVAGERGRIYRTINGGVTWNSFSIIDPNAPDVNSIHALDANNVIIANGYRINDVNAQIKFDTLLSYYSKTVPKAIFFSDSLTGFAGVTDDKVLKTIDGGCTWSEIPTGFNGYRYIFSIAKYGNTIILGVSYGDVIVSTDNGLTWNEYQFYSGSNSLNDIKMIDSNIAYGRTVDRIYKTTNGGQTWTSEGLYDGNDAFYLDANTVWITAYQGNKLKRTLDGGQTWSDIFMPNSLSPEAIYFKSVAEGWAAYDNLLFHTVDSGQTWAIDTINLPLDFSFETYYDIFFFDNMEGWITGRQMLHTTDGGTTWDINTLSDGGYIQMFSRNLGYTTGTPPLKYSFADQAYNMVDTQGICFGDTAYFNGVPTTVSGEYLSYSCDTLQKVNFTVHPSVTSTLSYDSTEIIVIDAFQNYQWYYNDTLISGATGQSLIPSLSGYYYAELFDNKGCNGFTDTIEFIMVSNKNIVLRKDFQIYPNPNNGQFIIETEIDEAIIDINIINILGQVIWTQPVVNDKYQYHVNLETIGDGYYFVQLRLQDGGVLTRKIIVE